MERERKTHTRRQEQSREHSDQRERERERERATIHALNSICACCIQTSQVKSLSSRPKCPYAAVFCTHKKRRKKSKAQQQQNRRQQTSHNRSHRCSCTGDLLLACVVVCACLVDGTSELEIADDATGAEVEVRLDDGEEFRVALGTGSVRVNEHGQRVRNTDGVRHLHEAATSQLGGDERLGDPSHGVRSRAVDLNRQKKQQHRTSQQLAQTLPR